MLCYRLIRSNRKTIQIQILFDKTIEVRAPKNVSDKRISSFVTSKEKWINKKIVTIQHLKSQAECRISSKGKFYSFKGVYPMFSC